MTPDAARMRRVYARHRAAGLCTECRRPTDRPRRDRCTGCARRRAAAYQGRRRWSCGCCGERGHNSRTCPDPRAREVI